MEKKYDVKICNCGRIHFISNKEIDEAIKNKKELLMICGGGGKALSIGAEEDWDEFENKACWMAFCYDIQKDFEPEWQRRPLWDRSYSESRTPPVPAMLLELLSHQNLADMKYGLDPGFRFTVSRAIYKGMLKYLSNRYGVPYAV